MKKGLLVMALLGSAFTAQAQQVNGGFDEAWVNCVPWTSGNSTKTQGTQPVDWTISHVSGMNGLGATGVATSTEGYNGTQFAVALKNAPNSIAKTQTVPAYMTLGTTWSTAKGFAAANKDGGTFGGITFTYQPDALRFFYKRSHGTGKPEEPASVIAYLWKGTYTQAGVPGEISLGTPKNVDMQDRDRNILGISLAGCQGGAVSQTDDAACIARIEHYIQGDVAEWTECLVPFEYDATLGADVRPEKLNIILAANDYFAGSAAVGQDNTLIVDEVSLVYYSQLASLSYNGTPVAGFDKDVYAYTVQGDYTDGCLEAVKNCMGGTCTVGAYDEANKTVTITVKGDDWSEANKNEHSYVVTFVEAQPEVTEYTNLLTVNINGQTTEPQETTIQLIKELDGSYSFALNNFMLGSGDEAILVGNIRLTNLTVEGNTFTANQTIAITGGMLDEILQAVPVVLTAVREGDNLTADIDIDMVELLGQAIKVIFAPGVEMIDTEIPTITGLQNVTLQRAFKAGWNTICLPFDYSLITFGEKAKAQAFVSATAEGLNFESVEEMKANVPYLLYLPNDITPPLYFGVNVAPATPQSVTYGDFTFTGTYEPMSMAGKYGVATVDGVDKIVKGGANATVKGTRAYFTSTNANIKEMPLLIDGVATGVAGVQAAEDAAYDVYTLTGIQVRKGATTLGGLPKGIYIVNGKKMYIK